MNTLTIALVEIKQQFKSVTATLFTFILPLLLIFILGSSLSGLSTFTSSPKQEDQVKVGIVDLDRHGYSDHLQDFIEQSEAKKLITLHQLDSAEQLERDLRNGIMNFGVVIPSDFSDAIAKGQNAEHWQLVLGNDYYQNLTAKLVFQSFIDQLNNMQAIKQILGPQVALTSPAASGQYNSEPIVKQGKLSEDTSYEYTSFQYYAVSVLIMFLLYTGREAAVSIMTDKENYILQRMQAMPIHPSSIICGKILGNTIIALMQAFIIIAITKYVYGVDWGRSWGLLLLAICLIIVSAMGLGVLLLLRAKSAKSVHSIYQLIIVVMTAISGGFSPIEGAEPISQFTISYWGMQGIFDIMLSSSMELILHKIVILGGISAVLILISVMSYRKVVAYE
ncbi:ABC transporter permease [Paenibacillus albiflavus]|uniref:ABC transporter permease n=1 Tax=Paenibacillus albiflavus TaxID=2545760 RepID=A0A4R4EJ88_9BACL|nr:ABC transporter permease [Paenibacillus albiflavus]TCZ79473.1 ABC transporter permease [Paenibacillus albiflavus]